MDRLADANFKQFSNRSLIILRDIATARVTLNWNIREKNKLESNP